MSVLSRDLGIQKSTLYRYLTVLTDLGYVHKDQDSSRYSLGAMCAWLGAQFLERLDVRRIASPVLQELANRTAETIHLAVLDSDEATYIDKIDGRQAVRMASRIGLRVPLYCTALGKVLLAHRTDGEWCRYVERRGLKPRTPNTIVTPQAFYDELTQVRRRGYAIDNIENEDGIRCLAAPIFDHTGNAPYAVSISGWTGTATLDRVEEWIPLICSAAREISQLLGNACRETHEASPDA